MLPITTADYSAALPGAGTKRKRDALVEVEQRGNNGVHLSDHHRRHNGGSRKRKGTFTKGGVKTLGINGGNEDWSMNVEDDGNERDRKRVRG